MILPNFIGHYKDSVVFAFWRRRGQKRERVSVRQASSELLQFDSPGQPGQFPRATKTVLACSHRRSLQLLRTVGSNEAKSYSSEIKFCQRWEVEAGHAHSCNN